MNYCRHELPAEWCGSCNAPPKKRGGMGGDGGVREPWTHDDKKTLERMANDGAGAPAIAARLGRTVHAVWDMAYELRGVPGFNLPDRLGRS